MDASEIASTPTNAMKRRKGKGTGTHQSSGKSGRLFRAPLKGKRHMVQS
jgi:hypothetical protein